MLYSNLDKLKLQLDSLAVFRGLLSDDVVASLYNYLDNPTVRGYSDFVAKLYRANMGNLSKHINSICENDENVYVKAIGNGESVPEYLSQCVKNELQILQYVAELSAEELCQPLEWSEALPKFCSDSISLSDNYAHRTKNIGKYGYGAYAKHSMFYVDDTGSIVPVNNPDPTRLSDLMDYKREQQIIIDNTKALLEGKPAANILLTGDAGTGKSSTIKAVTNELFSEGLRIIEMSKDKLSIIPKILNELADNPLKFIIFIDDLSFLKDDDNFNALKAVLEGSVSAKSKNVVIYATSNRRHIIRETFGERGNDDVHRNETMQEVISLSERFGIHITFQKPNKDTFLRIVYGLAEAKGIDMSKEELAAQAERMALERGGRSARLAKQYIDYLLSAK